MGRPLGPMGPLYLDHFQGRGSGFRGRPPRTVPHAAGSRRSTGQALPMATPASSTSTPPSTTWRAARQNGVSM